MPVRSIDTKTIARLAEGSVLDERSLALRRLAIKGAVGAGRGHIGGAMSMIEILRVLYDDIMRYRPVEPQWKERDRLILSKGHSCLGLYAILSDKGFFPPEELNTCFQKGSRFGGHPEYGKIPGVEATSGALGHGLPIGVGMALAARMQGRESRIFVLLGDGESQEGSVWEAALCAAHHQLSNLIVIVDYNKVQSSGKVKDIANLEPFAEKWKSFGFDTREINGHDMAELREMFKKLPFSVDKPSAVICHTVKGKGIPTAEYDAKWHYKKVNADVIKELNQILT